MTPRWWTTIPRILVALAKRNLGCCEMKIISSARSDFLLAQASPQPMALSVVESIQLERGARQSEIESCSLLLFFSPLTHLSDCLSRRASTLAHRTYKQSIALQRPPRFLVGPQFPYQDVDSALLLAGQRSLRLKLLRLYTTARNPTLLRSLHPLLSRPKLWSSFRVGLRMRLWASRRIPNSSSEVSTYVSITPERDVSNPQVLAHVDEELWRSRRSKQGACLSSSVDDHETMGMVS